MLIIVVGWIGTAALIFFFFLASVDRLALRGFGQLIGRLRFGKRRPGPLPWARILIWGTLIIGVVAAGIVIIATTWHGDRLSAMTGLSIGLFLLCALGVLATHARRADLRRAAEKNLAIRQAGVQREVSVVPPGDGAKTTYESTIVSKARDSSARAIYTLVAVILFVAFVGFAFLVPIGRCGRCNGIGKLQPWGQTIVVCSGCDGDGRRTLWDMVR